MEGSEGLWSNRRIGQKENFEGSDEFNSSQEPDNNVLSRFP